MPVVAALNVLVGAQETVVEEELLGGAIVEDVVAIDDAAVGGAADLCAELLHPTSSSAVADVTTRATMAWRLVGVIFRT
ncbi:MAG: hypothetical protein M3083_21775 [Actinomycetota bacterium]|nr:hypothetical protein [Actinomycetota bacterium]